MVLAHKGSSFEQNSEQLQACHILGTTGATGDGDEQIDGSCYFLLDSPGHDTVNNRVEPSILVPSLLSSFPADYQKPSLSENPIPLSQSRTFKNQIKPLSQLEPSTGHPSQTRTSSLMPSSSIEKMPDHIMEPQWMSLNEPNHVQGHAKYTQLMSTPSEKYNGYMVRDLMGQNPWLRSVSGPTAIPQSTNVRGSNDELLQKIPTPLSAFSIQSEGKVIPGQSPHMVFDYDFAMDGCDLQTQRNFKSMQGIKMDHMGLTDCCGVVGKFGRPQSSLSSDVWSDMETLPNNHPTILEACLNMMDKYKTTRLQYGPQSADPLTARPSIFGDSALASISLSASDATKDVSLTGLEIPSDDIQHSGIVINFTPYTKEERLPRIERYRRKRTERDFNKKIKYTCRKTLADSRPRIKGRFARTGDE
ncbi:hypothetical protein KP509_32G038300 [Ceratopteris richardii]|uniref:CCT domain-containing protein n=1 Tax=Ceratopteris richardii TaxID=49495 RepID=A0A8T2QU41_CERRI|nr:hypothetical protein KP509_32G038300 [Ceratopteris richardii]KAH7287104.1 hypothetical protein KP509_32G038300 [Ceratopteris richardii]